MTRYDDVSGKEPVSRSKYLFRDEWEVLTPEQRIIHSNRNLPGGCTHKASLDDWPEGLRESFSFDPYFHTAHMEPCQRPAVDIKNCPCQMCRGRIGVGN